MPGEQLHCIALQLRFWIPSYLHVRAVLERAVSQKAHATRSAALAHRETGQLSVMELLGQEQALRA